MTIDVQNLDEKTNCSFEAQLVAASTTDAGNIDYTPSKQSIFHKPGPLLPDLVTKNMRKQSFSVEKGLSKKITFPIQIPKKGFNGEILGSIYILKIQNEKQHNNGLAITNNYAMTIPVLLSQDFEKKVMPELSLSNIKIKDLNGNTKITGKISNNKPTMFGHIKLKAWITKKNEDKQLYSNNSDGFINGSTVSF